MKAPQGAFLWLCVFDVLAVATESKSRTGAREVAMKFRDPVFVSLAAFYNPVTTFRLRFL
jgi:hypothetical protein